MDVFFQDPLTRGAVSGVIANGLTALISHMWQSRREASENEAKLRQLLEKEVPLATILQRAAVAAARLVNVTDKEFGDKLRLFLVSPEVDAIVRQIYAIKLDRDLHGSHLPALHAEFHASLALHIGRPEGSLRELSESLMDALLTSCERALEVSIEKGVLSAHEAKSAARHRLVLDELAVIQKNVNLLTAPVKPDVCAILEFEEKYRCQVGNRHGHIMPPYFDVARKVPIDDIYVAPQFICSRRKPSRERDTLGVGEFLSTIHRAVILGNPGGGKSTFAAKLCYDLTTRYNERLFAHRAVTPILVVLREYGVEKKARGCSILQFIEATANSRYQVQPPPGSFEYLLLNGRAVVIFDGLDELLETAYRQEISNDVESFCTLYPSAPVLVASREVGYEQAPLDEKKFELFHLAPLGDKQVREYVTKWFALDAELTSDQQRQKTTAFLEETEIVPDLRSNPLMLALMCNIYRGENYIPRNRPDVYEKCATMMFERWDKSRGIHTILPFEFHISQTIKYLAHWIYADESLQAGVTEEDLVEKSTSYLLERRYENPDEARAAAREFVDFCRGRAWVFTDTGTTKEGTRLYQFTHKTFIEYFTAGHLVRIHPTPCELAEELLPRIAEGEWDVVAQLAFQL